MIMFKTIPNCDREGSSFEEFLIDLSLINMTRIATIKTMMASDDYNYNNSTPD